MLSGDRGSSGLKGDPASDFHGVVGEPFVVAAQQCYVDGGTPPATSTSQTSALPAAPKGRQTIGEMSPHR